LVCFVLALMFPGLAVQPQPFAPFALGAGALFSLSRWEAGDRWISGGVSVDQSQKGGSVDQFL